MEVMQRAVVKSRTLKPLPGEITDARIRDATLPLKVEAARRAIAACTDLPELLKLKDQAEGLAAAVRIMKTVGPEMIRNANCLLADAWRKGGELLSAYSAVPTPRGSKSKGGMLPSKRATVSRELGLVPGDVNSMVRLAAAPKKLVETVVQGNVGLRLAATKVPRVNPPRPGGTKAYSSALASIMGCGSGFGLSNARSYISRIPLDAFAELAPDERKIVKAKITEIVELLDEMDRLCR